LACGEAGSLVSGLVPWTVVLPGCDSALGVTVGVVLEASLAACVADPDSCGGNENFPGGESNGCADEIDNDGDGLVDIEDPDCRGPSAWSFSLATDACFQLESATMDGTVSALTTDGGLRAPGGGGFAVLELVDPGSNGGVHGVVGAVVLALSVPITLEPKGDSLVARVVATLSPDNPGPCALRFDEPTGGLAGSGSAVRTVVRVPGDSLTPVLLDSSVTLTADSGEDCNQNGDLDSCEISSGAVADCNFNGIPDSCDVTSGFETDCDGNGAPDSCDVSGGAADCNSNGLPDACELASGQELDCDGGGTPDSCEIAAGAADCNSNGIPDACDLASGFESDCDGGGIPDSCEISGGDVVDCDGNGVPDACDISGGAADCDANGVPDDCEFAASVAFDCDGNGVPDSCDISGGVPDCDANGVPDGCEISAGVVFDCDGNGVPDGCDISRGVADCNSNGLSDLCEISSGMVTDCDGNGVLDGCDVSDGEADCNSNGIPDACDIATGASLDVDENGRPDECSSPSAPRFLRGDCDGDGSACSGVGDALSLLSWFFLGAQTPGCLAACNSNGDGALDGVSDAVYNLSFCFKGGPPPPLPYPICGEASVLDESFGCLEGTEACP